MNEHVNGSLILRTENGAVRMYTTLLISIESPFYLTPPGNSIGQKPTRKSL